MNEQERNLLLTTARILRARIKEDTHDPSGNNYDDYLQIDEALKPFDGSGDEPINLAAQSA